MEMDGSLEGYATSIESFQQFWEVYDFTARLRHPFVALDRKMLPALRRGTGHVLVIWLSRLLAHAACFKTSTNIVSLQ